MCVTLSLSSFDTVKAWHQVGTKRIGEQTCWLNLPPSYPIIFARRDWRPNDFFHWVDPVTQSLVLLFLRNYRVWLLSMSCNYTALTFPSLLAFFPPLDLSHSSLWERIRRDEDGNTNPYFANQLKISFQRVLPLNVLSSLCVIIKTA